MLEKKWTQLFFITIFILCSLSCERKNAWEIEWEDEVYCGGDCLPQQKFNIENAQVVDQVPMTTTEGNEATIRSLDIVENSFGFDLELEIVSSNPLQNIYLDLGELVLKYPLDETSSATSDPYFTIEACNILAQQQGITCTPLCLEACSCISCQDQVTSEAALQACAVTCSVHRVNNSWNEDLFQNEQDFAYKIYNGHDVAGSWIPGLVESIPQCQANRCEPYQPIADQEMNQTVAVPFIGTDTQSALNMLSNMGSSIYVESQSSNTGETLVSTPFATSQICARQNNGVLAETNCP